MQIKLKKILAGLCCLAMMTSICAVPAISEDTAAAEAEATEEAEEEEKDDDEVVLRTEDEAMELMELVTENDNLALYLNDKEDTIALLDKKTNKIWWQNPINADASEGKKAQIQELKAGMTLIYGEPSKRRTTTQNSKVKGKVKYKEISNGLEATYKFANAEITIPVTYTLESDHLKLHVDTTAIKEENYDKITTNLAFMTTFGAAGTDEKGYYVIPDGSGTTINFNNGKTGLNTYKGKVYGKDITAVSLTNSAKTQQVYFPMYGIVKGNSGMMVVADKGDSCATINAYVAGQNKTSYNTCYFDFELRTNDEYLMGGEANPLKVFEKRGILVPEIEVRYYPVSNDSKSEIDYIDIADKYREYLTSSEYGVTKSDTVSESHLYVDLYGAVMKQESVLGVPVTMQHEATNFKEAQEILAQIKSVGTDSVIVNYNHWTTADIKEKVADAAKPASVLGGKSDFNDLLSYAQSNNIDIYPAVDNLTFRSSLGYWTMTNTAIRVSNAYSRQLTYDLAYGIENKYYDALSLLSPRAYEKVFTNLAKSYSKYGLTNISFGSASTALYGDYGRNSVSREMFKNNLREYYKMADEQVGSVLADGANAYILPYVDHITNVPLNSSKYDLFDQDIPFYQIVMHGLKSYSTTAVNGDADIAELILKAVASGSNLSFDLIADEANELKDTRYDIYYYADEQYWTADAANCHKLINDILSDVSDKRIVEYNVISADEIETVYDNGTKISVNIADRSIIKNGKTYSLYDYIGKEVIG
ncbi:MAG: hypothetical protein IJ007_00180 [Oscillospiraceae bacterium]|nr:hypothetical protein [Oscillospiraceae bacterium]